MQKRHLNHTRISTPIMQKQTAQETKEVDQFNNWLRNYAHLISSSGPRKEKETKNIAEFIFGR